MKNFLTKALIRNNTKTFIRANYFLTFVTVISVFTIALETIASLNSHENFFRVIEYLVVTVFTLEYVARIYVNENKKIYMFSFFGLIDLISIVPSYLGLTNFTFLKSARIVRVLSFLRTIRLAKLARISKNSNSNSKKSKEIQFISVRIYGIILVAVVFIFAGLLYLVGGNHTQFENLPMSILWVSQIILGGSVDIEELSLFVQVLVVMIQFSGLLLFGLVVHVVGRFLERQILGSSRIS